MMLPQKFYLFCLFLCPLITYGGLSQHKLFDKIELRSDTTIFDTQQHSVKYRGDWNLPFYYTSEDEIVEFRLFINENELQNIQEIKLINSPDYQLMDSIQYYNNHFYKFRLKFKNLSSSDFNALNFQLKLKDDSVNNFSLPLLPYTQTSAVFYPKDDDLFIGEEKRFEVITNNVNNLKIEEKWKTYGSIDYRFIKERDKLFIAIVANATGNLKLPLTFETKRPFLKEHTLSNKLPQQVFKLYVKGSRLRFLKADTRTIIKPKSYSEEIEVSIDNHRWLEMDKTYRIEQQEEKGGRLIAELFTKTRLSNDKVLCIIRPYAYHSISDGYLFIKDGDQPKFITNINILPEVSVQEIKLYRDGAWKKTNVVYPGETVEVRLKGEGMNRSNLKFEEVPNALKDTISVNQNRVDFTLEIPKKINKRSIEIFNHGVKMQEELQVKEHQKPRELDFVYLNYGDEKKSLTKLKQAVLYKETIKDVIVSFDYNGIDSDEELYGKQFLEIQVRLLSERNELIELKTIENIEVCPGSTSPRYNHSNTNTCTQQEIRLNDYLNSKTYNLKDWSKIEIVVKHQKNKYSQNTYEQKVLIVAQRLLTFDVDVSFPAGLLIKKVGEEGFPRLGGISLAMLAQFTFYHPNKIMVERPFKIGAGFLAQNAFNFNPDAQNRDLGILLMGSVYPIKKTKKLSFPLYAGFGYFLSQAQFFYLIGPGINVNF